LCFELYLQDKERARIEERYLRLQDTMRALQDEIKVANLNHEEVYVLSLELGCLMDIGFELLIY